MNREYKVNPCELACANQTAHNPCPHIKTHSAYDPIRMKTYEGPDTCDINDKICELEHFNSCETFEDILRGN